MDLLPGKIRVKQGQNPEINMHMSISDGEDADAYYEPLTEFSCAANEETDIPLLSTVAGRHSAEPVKQDYMIAKGDVWSMHTDLRDDGGKLEIEAIQVKKSGLAGTDDEVVSLYPDDFKYNIKLEWPDLPDQEVGTFVYVRIEYRIENAAIVKAGEINNCSIYLVTGRTNLIIHVPKTYYVLDGKSNTMQERTMEDGYPKLCTSQHDKSEHHQMFTFQFVKSNKVLYDPCHSLLPVYSI